MAQTKGSRTRAHIVSRAAGVFNTRGYFGTSMADVLDAVGLGKGGVYNHFSSKDELALASFDFAVSLIGNRFRAAVRGKSNALERLLAVVAVIRSLAERPCVRGGCPVMNTAIEADDAHPALRERARRAMDGWRALVIRLVRRGIERRELRADADPDVVASVLIATIEGGVMLSKLYRHPVHVHRAADHLTRYLQELAR